MWRSIAAALIVAAGCGGDDAVQVVGGDARPCPDPDPCNPLAPAGQQGCGAGEKCSALVLRTGVVSSCPENLQLGCVPAGEHALGASCVWSAPTMQRPGYDSCVTGALCASDLVCRDICGFGATPEEACGAGLTCFAMPGRFEPEGGGEARYGACAPGL
jgi:hypothetical protein